MLSFEQNIYEIWNKIKLFWSLLICNFLVFFKTWKDLTYSIRLARTEKKSFSGYFSITSTVPLICTANVNSQRILNHLKLCNILWNIYWMWRKEKNFLYRKMFFSLLSLWYTIFFFADDENKSNITHSLITFSLNFLIP